MSGVRMTDIIPFLERETAHEFVSGRKETFFIFHNFKNFDYIINNFINFYLNNFFL